MRNEVRTCKQHRRNCNEASTVLKSRWQINEVNPESELSKSIIEDDAVNELDSIEL